MQCSIVLGPKKMKLTSFTGFHRDGSAEFADADPVEGGHLDFVVLPGDEVFNEIVALILVGNVSIRPRAVVSVAVKAVADRVSGHQTISMLLFRRLPLDHDL